MSGENELGLSPESIAEFAGDDFTPESGAAGAAGQGDDNAAAEAAAQAAAQAAAAQAAANPGGQSDNGGNLNPYWQKLQKDVTAHMPDYKLPEVLVTRKKEDGTDLTLDEEFDLLRQEILNFTEDPVGNDPLIQSYLAAKSGENFNEAQWIADQAKNYQFLTAPAKDIVLEAFRITNEKEKKGWTEENIKSFVDGMNPIQLEMQADAIRNSYRANLSEVQKQSEAVKAQQFQKFVETKTQENLSLAKEVLAEVSKVNSFGGVPHGQTEIQEFQPIYEKLVTVNPETGNAFALDLLMDNQNLYKALYLLHATDKGLIANFKEEFKAEVLNKLDVSKKSSQGGAANLAIEMTSDDYI